MVARPAFSSADTGSAAPDKISQAASALWLGDIARLFNFLQLGKSNNVDTITLRAGQATTDLNDARIGPFTAILLQPLTANAHTDNVSATGVLVNTATQKNGFATLKHPNNANADKTFNVVYVG